MKYIKNKKCIVIIYMEFSSKEEIYLEEQIESPNECFEAYVKDEYEKNSNHKRQLQKAVILYLSNKIHNIRDYDVYFNLQEYNKLTKVEQDFQNYVLKQYVRDDEKQKIIDKIVLNDLINSDIEIDEEEDDEEF
eukprot:gene1964-1472_t